MVRLNINGKDHDVDVDDTTPLLWAIRDNVGLTGTKYGCGIAQCGYCQTGMIMAVAALLKDNPKPSDADIDGAITNICRCGTYQQVREAIHAAASA